MRRLSSAFFLLAALVLSVPGRAQLIMRTHAPKGTLAPRVLLVLLPTGESRVRALLDAGDTLNAGAIGRDLAGVRQKMVLDFNENFKYCPYYFVADSDYYRLQNRDYAGVLLDSTLKPVPAPVIDTDDNTILIARYGYRERDPNEKRNTLGGTVMSQFNGDTEAMLQQLVLSDGSFRQLVRPFPRTVDGPVPRENIKRPRYEYRYQSRSYDIQYRASASAATLKLERFYGPSKWYKR